VPVAIYATELTIGMQLLSSVAIMKLVYEPAGENTSEMHALQRLADGILGQP